ncbi:MAG: CotS family spore coat protein [Bacillota bacterium]|nr:MAG: hypothetical protein DIU70_08055 [Bacillota bacterium]
MPSELQQVLEGYGIRGIRLQLVTDNPRKPVWRIRSPQGEFYLKRMAVSPGRLRFILAAMEHLERGGVRLPPVVPTVTGEPYLALGSHLYLLTRAVAGQDLDYGTHLPLIVRSLARFHRAGRGFAPPPEAEVHSHLGRWPEHYRKKLEELDHFRARAASTPNPDAFCRIFLREVPFFRQQIEATLARLADGRYDAWVEKLRAEGCLSHQDYAASNLRLVDGEVLVFDLDSVTCDLPARDLRKLFNKVMKKGQWDSTLVRRILGLYQEVYPLTADERQVVATDVMFPHLFCGAVNKYFTGRAADWPPEKLVAKLQEAIRSDRQKLRTLSAFR